MSYIIFKTIHVLQWVLLPVTFPTYFAVHEQYCPENGSALAGTRIGHTIYRVPSAIGAVALPYPLVESATEGKVNE